MDTFSVYQQVNKNRQATRSRQYELSSANRLAKILNRRFDTTNIGSIASIEKHLGFLWGHGKDEKTENEKKWLIKWQALRKELLDKGNHQLRAMLEELNQYTVVWNRHNVKLEVKDE